MPVQRHTLLRDRLIRRLNQRPDWLVWKVNQIAALVGKRMIRTGPPGQPDLYGVKAVEITQDMVGKKVGMLVGIEIKVGTDTQRETQKHWQKLLESRHAVYRILWFEKRKRSAAKSVSRSK